MIELSRGELKQIERSLQHATVCGGPSQPGRALLELARGDRHAAATSIDTALADPGLDDLRRARLLPAAVQIYAAVGRDDHSAGALAELEQLAERYQSEGLVTAARPARPPS